MGERVVRAEHRGRRTVACPRVTCRAEQSNAFAAASPGPPPVPALASMSSAVVRSLRTLVASSAMRPPCVDFERAKSGMGAKPTKADKRNGGLHLPRHPLSFSCVLGLRPAHCAARRAARAHVCSGPRVRGCAPAPAPYSHHVLCTQWVAARCTSATSRCLRPREHPRYVRAAPARARSLFFAHACAGAYAQTRRPCCAQYERPDEQKAKDAEIAKEYNRQMFRRHNLWSRRETGVGGGCGGGGARRRRTNATCARLCVCVCVCVCVCKFGFASACNSWCACPRSLLTLAA